MKISNKSTATALESATSHSRLHSTALRETPKEPNSSQAPTTCFPSARILYLRRLRRPIVAMRAPLLQPRAADLEIKFLPPLVRNHSSSICVPKFYSDLATTHNLGDAFTQSHKIFQAPPNMTSLEQLISTLQKVDKVNFKSESERVQAQNAILGALSRVQTPWDVAQQHIWGDPITTTIVKILVDVDLWKKWVEAGGKPSTSSELAGLVNVDPSLLSR